MKSEGGSESTLGCEGSAQSGCEQIWACGRGAQADLERLILTVGGVGAGARCPRGSGPERTQESRVRRRGEGRDRAGRAWGHSSRRWRLVTDLKFLKNHTCALWKRGMSEGGYK